MRPIRLQPVLLAVLLGLALALSAGQSLESARASGTAGAPAKAVFGPTLENKSRPPGAVPQGMVWIPGGEFSMGAADPLGHDMNAVGMHATDDSRPIHRVYVDGFFMDKTEVTNAQFARFVEATGYVTVAERAPRAEDFPGAAPESLVAGSIVFSPPSGPVPLDNELRWWSYVEGAGASSSSLGA